MHKKLRITQPDGEIIKIDLFYAKPANVKFALFHFRNGKFNNIRLRHKLKKMGYKLNQYGLFKGNKKICYTKFIKIIKNIN